jgi:hypothetical protein
VTRLAASRSAYCPQARQEALCRDGPDEETAEITDEAAEAAEEA